MNGKKDKFIKKKKKRAFTLIELLAVIVILGIIAVIAVPAITKYIEKSKIDSFRRSTESIFSAATHYLVDNDLDVLPDEGIEITELDYKKTKLTGGKVYSNGEKFEVENVTDGEFCANGIEKELEVVHDKCEPIIMESPTFALDKEGWSQEKNTTITYPDGTDYFFSITGNVKADKKVYECSSVNEKTSVCDNTLIDENTSLKENTWYKTENNVKLLLKSNSNIIAHSYNRRRYKISTMNVDNIDVTIPTTAMVTTSKTGNSITVTSIGIDNESDIYGYQFSKDNGTTWTDIQTSNTYTFTSLTVGSYKVASRVINGTYVNDGINNNYLDSNKVTNIEGEIQDNPPVVVFTPTSFSFSPASAYKSKGGSDHDTQTLYSTVTSNILNLRGSTLIRVSANLYEGDTGHVGSGLSNPNASVTLYCSGRTITSQTSAGLGGKNFVLGTSGIDEATLGSCYLSVTGYANCYRRGIGISVSGASVSGEVLTNFTFPTNSAYLTKGGSEHDTQTLTPVLVSSSTINLAGVKTVNIPLNLYEGDTGHVGSGLSNPTASASLYCNGTRIAYQNSPGLGSKNFALSTSGYTDSQLSSCYVQLMGSANCYRRGIGITVGSVTLTK